MINLNLKSGNVNVRNLYFCIKFPQIIKTTRDSHVDERNSPCYLCQCPHYVELKENFVIAHPPKKHAIVKAMPKALGSL